MQVIYLPGERSTAEFTIVNPSNTVEITVQITPQTLSLVETTEFKGKTKVQQQDHVMNKTGTYAPNYVKLSDVKTPVTTNEFFEDGDPIT